MQVINPSNNIDDLLDAFFDNITTWIVRSGFVEHDLDRQNIEEILEQDPEEIKARSSEDLLIDTFSLYRYLDLLQAECNHQKMVLEYAETSILSLISDKLVQTQGDYTKNDVKYHNAVREDPMCVKLMDLVRLSRARITEADGRIYNVKKMAEILEQLAKKKMYTERAN